ncbi:hypothetical protein JAAARDRAFT_79457 [Jaapia argillacea MUCL 33604]|uniref:Uncharacterized protein n=1 Tax=Jaapia argillacea MUCL 33604 TaxID=933084 RepID=A0A067PNY2_9AGAM|nr:hypothetical protein JAAARDRAFT_79457 [Jaapia argillacea MUCL 33604]
MVQKERLEEFYGKQLIIANHDMVELESDEILRDVEKEDVALLIVGDPFGFVPSTSAIAVSRVGSGDKHEQIVSGTLSELNGHPTEAFGEPLPSLVIVGKRVHPLEIEYAQEFAINKVNWWRVAETVYGCCKASYSIPSNNWRRPVANDLNRSCRNSISVSTTLSPGTISAIQRCPVELWSRIVEIISDDGHLGTNLPLVCRFFREVSDTIRLRAVRATFDVSNRTKIRSLFQMLCT